VKKLRSTPGSTSSSSLISSDSNSGSRAPPRSFEAAFNEALGAKLRLKAMSTDEEDRFLGMADVDSHAEAMGAIHVHNLLGMTSHEKVEGGVIPVGTMFFASTSGLRNGEHVYASMDDRNFALFEVMASSSGRLTVGSRGAVVEFSGEDVCFRGASDRMSTTRIPEFILVPKEEHVDHLKATMPLLESSPAKKPRVEAVAGTFGAASGASVVKVVTGEVAELRDADGKERELVSGRREKAIEFFP
jgi:hypothetical protein